MEIEPISPQTPPVPPYEPPADEPPEESPQETPQSGEVDEPTPTTETTAEEPNETDELPGVIQHLLQGHYKGVSDLRLRINFFDQLAAIEAAKLQAATEQHVVGVAESVGAAADSFLTENELTEEQQTGVTQAQEQFELAANASQTEPVAGLQTAFADLVAALRNVFTPPPQPLEQQPPAGQEEPIADAEPPQAPPEPPMFWEAFIATLQSDFDAWMEALNNDVNTVKILPQLSDPNGNGVAYEKFLAIYNEMLDASTQGQTLNEAEPPEPTE